MDSDSDDEPRSIDLSVLQEGLSEDTLKALLAFLPNRRFEDDDEEDAKQSGGGNEAITESTLCMAYTQKDANVIAETLKRLTQQSLESQAKLEEVLQHRVLHPLLPTSTVEEALDVLSRDAVVRLNGVLSAELADECLAEISKMLSSAIEDNNPMFEETGFGNVLARECRWDMYLRNEGVFKRAMFDMLGRSDAALNRLFKVIFKGQDASFHEFSSLISDKGATPQPIHPDTVYTEICPLYTVFVALQDIVEDMGATIFLPRTNTRECHQEHKNTSTKDQFLASCEYRQSLLSKGDCALMDSRVLHSGDGNYNKRRVLLYFTVRNPLYTYAEGDPIIPTGSKWADMELNLTDCGMVL
jgi:hypothetical protein